MFGLNYSLYTESPEETQKAGYELAARLASGALICLYGELGAGKTHFAKGIASCFGIPPTEVDSPTFILLQEYYGRLPVYHFDAYRLRSAQEARDIGFEDYIYGDGISIVEWPEKVSALLPAARTEVHIRHAGTQQRHIEVVNRT